MTAGAVALGVVGVAGVVGAAGAGRVWRRWAGRWWWIEAPALLAVHLGGALGPQLAWLVAEWPVAFDLADPWFAVAGLFTTLTGALAALGFAGTAGLDLAARRVPGRRLLLGVAVGLGTAALSASFTLLAERLGADPADPPVAHSLFDPALPAFVRGLSAVATVAVAPVVEELLFRGALFGVLGRRFGAPVALTVTAGVFGAAHGLEPVVLASALSYGVAWGWLRARTGSVWPGVAAHLTNNLCALLLPA